MKTFCIGGLLLLFAAIVISFAGCGGADDNDDSSQQFAISEGMAITDLHDPDDVHAADLDGDGDFDVLSGSWTEENIAWHENTAGDGSAWVDHVIALGLGSGRCIFAADVDGDGDLDVLTALATADAVAWHENTAGDGSAWTSELINNNAPGVRSVFAADIDGDGDVDALSGSPGDDTVAWYENTAGDGSAWTKHIVDNTAFGVYSTFAADMDSDGDIDIVSGWGDGDTVAWHENTAGDGSTWTTRDITALSGGTVDFVEKVFVADLDGDGDLDVLSASYYDDKIAWYENLSGDGMSWRGEEISTTADGCYSIVAADLDSDGDSDVVSGSDLDGKLAWYENTDGKGTYGEQQILLEADNCDTVYAADIDGDQDPDIISGATKDGTKIWWFESR
jgi:hypothetical protein